MQTPTRLPRAPARAALRNRHHPRLCQECRSPLARQADACWSCGTTAGAEPPVRTPKRMRADVRPPVVRLARATTSAEDRWTNEGGHAATARR